MGSSYNFRNPDGIYFVTFTVVQWVDVFTRQAYRDVLIDSLKFCQNEKGLNIHAWVIMSNHLHLVISRQGEQALGDIVRDLKKFTSKEIIQKLHLEQESRRSWMLWIFQTHGERNPNNKNYQLWIQDNHPEELWSNHFIDQKLNYVHYNPVKAGIVAQPEDYLYSSAMDHTGEQGLLEVAFLD